MNEFEVFEKKFNKQTVKYFKKYFLNKNLLDATEHAMKNEILAFLNVYSRFHMLSHIFSVMKEDTKKVSPELYKILDKYIEILKMMDINLYEIMDKLGQM